MYQTIHESISVAGVFGQGKFHPKKFRWGKRDLSVEQVTHTFSSKDGGVLAKHYSVVAGGTVYRLVFTPENFEWFLEEIWNEG